LDSQLIGLDVGLLVALLIDCEFSNLAILLFNVVPDDVTAGGGCPRFKPLLKVIRANIVLVT